MQSAALAVLLAVAGAKEGGLAKGPEAAKEVKQIVLTDKSANRVFLVRTAVGYPAVLEFPEGFAGQPACGDCGKTGLFQVDVFEAQRYLTVKPRLYPGPQPDGSNIPESEFVTTINVRLVSGLTLTVQVELVSNKAKADARVVFVRQGKDPQAEYLRQQVEQARAEMERSYAPKVAAAARKAFLSALAEPHECVKSSKRTRHDSLVVEVKELCRFGNSVYVRFEVENRGDALWSLGEVDVVAQAGKEVAPVDGLEREPEQAQVAFDQTVPMVVGFRSEGPAKSYRLTLRESGGKNREVVLSGLGF